MQCLASIAIEVTVQPPCITVVSSTATQLAHVINVIGHKATLSARQGHKAAFCVTSRQVVVVARWRVGRRTQEGSVLDVRPCDRQICLMLLPYDIVNILIGAIAAIIRHPEAWLFGAGLSPVLTPT